MPANRGPEPAEPARADLADHPPHAATSETPTITQPFLLRTAHDERLFRYYTTAQLVTARTRPRTAAIGAPAMYLDYWVSPDGKAILRETLEEPFSYLSAFSGFGRQLEVIDLDGKVLSDDPAAEAARGARLAADTRTPTTFPVTSRGVQTARACRCSGASRHGEGDAAPPRQDRIMLLAPPSRPGRAPRPWSRPSIASRNVRYSRDGRYAM